MFSACACQSNISRTVAFGYQKSKGIAVEVAKTNFVVPATPGFFILSTCRQDGKIVDARREPIIAFAIDSEGITHPVTLDYVEDHGDPSILTPDGNVHSWGQTWEDLDAWLAEAIEQDAQKAANAVRAARGAALD